MGIRVNCPNCGKQLNVKSFLAGKRGVCPDCRGKFDIPGRRNVTIEVDDSDEGTEVSTVSAPNTPAEAAAANPAPQYAPEPIAPKSFAPIPMQPAPIQPAPLQPAAMQPATLPATADAWAQVPAAAVPYPAQPAMPAMPQPASPYAMPMPMSAAPAEFPAAVVPQPTYQAPAPVDPITEAPQAQWYVRPPVGGQFGPAVGDIMRQWIHERRVTPDSLVWREGWADWQRADMVFPGLAAPQVALPAMTPMVSIVGGPTMMPAGPFAGAAAPLAVPFGVDPAPAAFPAEEPVRPTPVRPFKKKSNNTNAIVAAILVVALIVLVPLFAFVLMKQLK